MAEKASFKTVTALVVDDNEHMLAIATTMLRAFGFGRVLNASNGADGFDMFCKTDVDLIILDYHMPGMDGHAFSHIVRTGVESPNKFTPIIMLSAHAEISCICKARDEGVTEFMCKPISPSELYKKISMVVEHPRAFISVEGYFGPDRRRRRDPKYIGAERRTAEKPDNIYKVSA